MIYILYYNFKHTADNHAGMSYLAKYLAKTNSNIKLIKHISQERTAGKYIGLFYAYIILLKLLFTLKKGDKVFFMEYLNDTFAFQHKIAKHLKLLGWKNDRIGLVHLAGDHLQEIFPGENALQNELCYLDKVVVMGSTLKSFIQKTGFKNEVIRTYHYVDNNYYKPLDISLNTGRLKVIFIGNIKRNFKQLQEIINEAPKHIQFHICVGKSRNVSGLKETQNVKLYGFLEENELLRLMQKCHVSLSVMDDTIGSNAITTGLAVGLVQVVSEVGSIKDYCSISDSFFCNSTGDFLNALTRLSIDAPLLKEMQLNAVRKAQEFAIKSFPQEFLTFFKT